MILDLYSIIHMVDLYFNIALLVETVNIVYCGL
jgi:hypothetical protein